MSTAATPPLAHCFTVDVEEWFQVSALEPYVARGDWRVTPSRVAIGTDRLLALLDEAGAKGTFFTLGWVARHHPDVVRRIVAAGHELASHGWWHERVTTLDPQRFRTDVRDAKRLLEDVGGVPVLGYRAPSFSIIPGFEWALDVLAEEGYAYDSSLFPIRRRGYGHPDAPVRAHLLMRSGRPLLELPPATQTFGPLRVPAAGGGWFRQFPYALTRRALRQAERTGEPAVFYIHPWELDPDQPRLAVSLKTRIRHYANLAKMEERIRRMLAEFRFTTCAARLGLEPLATTSSASRRVAVPA